MSEPDDNRAFTEYTPMDSGQRSKAVGEDATPGVRAINEQNCPRAIGEQKVRSIMRLRAQRNAYLPANLFGEPGWDMLLILYLAELDQQRVAISDLCGASGCPASTALRWIRMLVFEDLAVRRTDPLDARRSFVSLTPKGLSAIESFLASVPHNVASV